MILLVLACRSGLAVVSDLHGDRWELVDPYSGAVKYVYDVDGNNVDDCRVHDDVSRFCLIYQSRHRVLADGSDEVAYTYTPVGEDSLGQDGLRGRIVGIVPDPAGTERWRLDRLDWSRLDPDRERCNWDEADPCHPAEAATEEEILACNLYWPHDFRIAAETADTLSVAIADTRNDRVVWADLPLGGGTCATVTEVLDAAHADWDTYASINALDLWEDETGRQLLLSSKDTLGGTAEAGQDGVESRGKILRWADPGTGWAQVWEFPPDGSGNINAPHGLARDDQFVYAGHGIGASDAWEDGLGGSVLVLDTAGTYLYDGIPASGTLLYTRSVSVLGGRELLVVDSGTKGDEHAVAETSLLVLELADPAPSAAGGTYSPDHADQEFRELRVVRRNTPEDAFVLYSAEPFTEVGSELGG